MQIDSKAIFTLPGVSEAYLRDRYGLARGHEIESGKFSSPVSSSCLAANAFAWFNERPGLLPPFAGLASVGEPLSVNVEVQMRCPWRGGVHPWLDAAFETDAHLVGVESKRFEPYRDGKTADFSVAYDRDVWLGLEPYDRVRQRLAAGDISFDHLDAAQLIKHALGLSTQGRKVGKAPILVYLFAEPATLAGKSLAAAIAKHRLEVAQFADLVSGASVRFCASSYRDWIATWPEEHGVAAHGRAILAAFHP